MRTCMSCGVSIDDRGPQARRCVSCLKGWEKERNAATYKANKEHELAKCAAWRKANPEKSKASIQKWIDSNQEKYKADSALRCAKHRDLLSDCYVAGSMGLRVSDCSNELIEMKRNQLLLSRTMRDLKNTLKEQHPQPKPPPPQEKTCIRCGEIKNLDAFAKRKDSIDGTVHTCKDCLNKRSRAKRKQTRELCELNKTLKEQNGR